jgi:hypothetical protein
VGEKLVEKTSEQKWMVKIKKKIICAFKCAKNNKVKISEQK